MWSWPNTPVPPHPGWFALLLLPLGWWLFAGGPEWESGEVPPLTAGSAFGGTWALDQAEEVEFAWAERDTLWIHVEGPGEVEPARQLRVASRASGVVLTLAVEEGAEVEAGQLLVQLDTAEAHLAWAQAQVTLARARIDHLERQLPDAIFPHPDPSSEGAKERERILRVVSGLEQAELAVAGATLSLEHTRIRAPFPGQITEIRVEAGMVLPPGAELLTLLTLSPLRVVVPVGEEDLAGLAVGGRATIRIPALGDETRPGVIQSISPRIDPVSRSARVLVALENSGGTIRPGMFVWVRLAAQPLPDRLLVPRSALLNRDGRAVVFVASGLSEEGMGRADWRDVMPGARNGTHVELLPGGVCVGERILVGGHYTLEHEAPIRVRNPGASRGVEGPCQEG